MPKSARTTVTIIYTDLPSVELSYPIVFTNPPELVPLGVRHVLSSTKPQLAPEIEALWKGLRTARNQGKALRSLHPGDRVSVMAMEAEYVWELTERGFALNQKNMIQ